MLWHLCRFVYFSGIFSASLRAVHLQSAAPADRTEMQHASLPSVQEADVIQTSRVRQDLFNRSDNLAEHFEFLDQQPKIFPGLASMQGFV